MWTRYYNNTRIMPRQLFVSWTNEAIPRQIIIKYLPNNLRMLLRRLPWNDPTTPKPAIGNTTLKLVYLSDKIANQMAQPFLAVAVSMNSPWRKWLPAGKKVICFVPTVSPIMPKIKSLGPVTLVLTAAPKSLPWNYCVCMPMNVHRGFPWRNCKRHCTKKFAKYNDLQFQKAIDCANMDDLWYDSAHKLGMYLFVLKSCVSFFMAFFIGDCVGFSCAYNYIALVPNVGSKQPWPNQK
jgi:hypothetical protein